MFRSNFLASNLGQRIVHVARRHRQIRFVVEGIEPQGKTAMSRKSKVSFQSRVLTELRLRRRLAYRDLLVLQLRMESSDRNPAHIHTIAKNVIDLLGRPLPEVSRRCGLLYRDDQQIHGLAVSCEHGVSAPSITVSARSLESFVKTWQ